MMQLASSPLPNKAIGKADLKYHNYVRPAPPTSSPTIQGAWVSPEQLATLFSPWPGEIITQGRRGSNHGTPSPFRDMTSGPR